MATTKLKLTRDQLASFLKTDEQIKQFEKLFSVVDEVAPSSDTAGISIDASNAAAKANVTLAVIDKLINDVMINESKLVVLAHLFNTTNKDIEQSLSQIESKTIKAEQVISTFQNNAAKDAAVLQSKINALQNYIESINSSLNELQLQPAQRKYKPARYGQFLDTTTQTAAAINTAYGITFNTTDLSSGVYLGAPASRIYVDTESLYDFQFSIQLDKTSGGTGEFYIWPRVNGVDVPNSCSQIKIQGNDAEVFSAANFFLNLKSNDYVEFMFAVSDTSVELKTFPATAFAPAIPSIIVTVSNNIKGAQ